MKTTVVIQIGNSDDKLTQLEWSNFIHRANSLIDDKSEQVHFTGFSVPTAIWQNACWVFTIDSDKSHELWNSMKQLRKDFRQDSIAWTEGVTVFLD